MARQREFEPTEVIDKSIDVFLSKGYEGAAIRDLIEVTNVKSGSLYNSFGSKKQMFKNALERFVEVSQFNITLADAETAPPRETIEKLFFDLIDVTDKRVAVGKCLISRATMEVGGVDKEITAWLQEVFEKSERLLCRLIERGQAAGEISSFRSPKELAQFLAITVQGMQVMARFERDNKKFRAIAETALAALDYEK